MDLLNDNNEEAAPFLDGETPLPTSKMFSGNFDRTNHTLVTAHEAAEIYARLSAAPRPSHFPSGYLSTQTPIGSVPETSIEPVEFSGSSSQLTFDSNNIPLPETQGGGQPSPQPLCTIPPFPRTQNMLSPSPQLPVQADDVLFLSNSHSINSPVLGLTPPSSFAGSANEMATQKKLKDLEMQVRTLQTSKACLEGALKANE